MDKKQNIRRILLAMGIVAILAFAVTAAYFTDTDSAYNIMTIGNVDIEVEEPSYDDEDPHTGIRQNQIIPKDPKINNIGYNSAIVFMKVTVPVREVYLTDDLQDKSKKELFWMLTQSAKNNFFPDTGTAESPFDNRNYFNTVQADANDTAYWIELPEKETGYPYTSDTRTYVFGYSIPLSKDSSTETLFDYVRFKPVIEGQLKTKDDDGKIINQSLDIQITAYAIQAENIDKPDSYFGEWNLSNGLDSNELEAVWDIYWASET